MAQKPAGKRTSTGRPAMSAKGSPRAADHAPGSLDKATPKRKASPAAPAPTATVGEVRQAKPAPESKGNAAGKPKALRPLPQGKGSVKAAAYRDDRIKMAFSCPPMKMREIDARWQQLKLKGRSEYLAALVAADLAAAKEGRTLID